MELLLIIIIPIIFGFITNSMGKNKGLNGQFWWGFFLGIIGIIVVALKKEKEMPIKKYEPVEDKIANSKYVLIISTVVILLLIGIAFIHSNN